MLVFHDEALSAQFVWSPHYKDTLGFIFMHSLHEVHKMNT